MRRNRRDYITLRLSTKKSEKPLEKKKTQNEVRVKTGQKTRNLFIKKKKQKKTNKKQKTKKKAMRDLAAKKSAKNRSLTFKKRETWLAPQTRFFLFRHEKVPFFGTFLGAFRGADFSRPSTCGRDVTLFPRHDARNNTTTHTHLRERERENVIKDDSPSDVVEARHRVKGLLGGRAGSSSSESSFASTSSKSIVIIVL